MSGSPDYSASPLPASSHHRWPRRALAVLVLLLLLGGPLHAEPLYPLLRPARADSLRRQLWHTPPSRQRIALLLILSQDLISGNWDLGTPLDSAAFYGQQAAALSRQLADVPGQIGSCYALGNLSLTLGNVPEGKKLLQQGLAGSTRHHHARLEADGWYYLAGTYTFSPADIPQRIACFQRARGLYQQLHDGIRAAFTLKTIADLHLLQGQEGLARAELLQVVAAYQAIGYRPLHYTYDLLSVADRRTGNFTEALRYALAAVASARATADTAQVNLFYSRVATIYRLLNQPAEALAVCQLLLRKAERTHDNVAVIDAATMMAHILIKTKQPRQALALALEKTDAYPVPTYQSGVWTLLAACYFANQQYALAEKYELQLISYLEPRQDLVGTYNNQLGYAYLFLGRLYLAMRRYEAARAYASKSSAARFQATITTKAETYQLQFKIDSTQGRYLAAIANQQRYQALADSMFNEKKSKQLASLQIQYNMQKKEQDLALLTKQNLVQGANIRRRELQRNASLAGAFLLAMLLGLGYNRYRLKQRSNRLLEAKQAEIFSQNQFLEEVLTEKNGLLEEKEWMLKEIHHRVKNNLQIIGSLLRSQAVYLQDGAARTAVRESRNRVHSMALIHQKLYQSNRLTGVPMDTYIREIVDHLLASFDCPVTIRTELAVAAVELDVALAVPVGLILNEAITNAFKYAFPAGRPGTLTIAFEMLPTGRYRLTVGDDGVGFAPDFKLAQSRTLGLSLIEGLSKQVDGHLQVAGDQGVHISLEFAQLALAARPNPGPKPTESV